MRNIPVFTSEYGVASLALESIPQRREAFVTLQSTMEPEKLLAECLEFCKMCGAERVWATGHPSLEAYPLHTVVFTMRGEKGRIGETDAALFPVQDDTAEKWRGIYNEKMAGVDNAAWITFLGMKKLRKENSVYFVHRDGVLLGIGMVSGDRIETLAAVRPGAGADVVRALCQGIFGEMVVLDVASTNTRAIGLYERLGFVKTAEKSRWHRVL